MASPRKDPSPSPTRTKATSGNKATPKIQRPTFTWTNDAVLIGQEGPEIGANKFELLPSEIRLGTGNVLDYSSPKISEGDIARIAQMYPSAGGSEVAGKSEWKGGWTPINMAAGARA
ncbi:hypothetical protein CLAFUW4_07973 [Fulvia fulva]|uniref:Uncharacterized protein n=1 Tax=Passalora fulva TaxID=5499 RepID=A0A9Q8LCW7_PASFU|nr:uncharacterized protein CLAFUR5_08095 [Fulvia fulva]KAK4628803.1 hypothetical protein CLAFUR4_07978 [Fulvia fulva]KAK4630370.1 hypothetical protein CLAFUR0_07975 [Fulvia fulva]UJO15086.1 hypothetical protein CLAFUR5_08095 [Fulvia fulva]WPV12464.1 hypothetical protein CLAFUW4_07973 [Fulvia fulva]WPV27222.1 hypothetical protein CLAFUW7_07974 [Fulvia fulva]